MSTTSSQESISGRDASAAPDAQGATPPRPARVAGVDIGRGLAMLLLVALGPVSEALRGAPDWPVLQFIKQQARHESWHGVNFVDFGLPAFIFLVGMSIPLALQRHLDRGQRKASVEWGIVQRAAILFFLGFLSSGGFRQPWPAVRLSGPLQRIAIVYLIGAFVFLYLRFKGQLAAFVVTLLGYWALLTFVPVPGYDAGDLSFEGNLAAYIDRHWLPGLPEFGFGQWDSEGIVTTLGALATCLLGMLYGHIFRDPRLSPYDRVRFLLLSGLALISAGYLWSEWMPLNKKLWTPSLVLFFGGQTVTYVALFHLIADVWKRNWLFFLLVVGQNSLVAYLAIGIIPFDDIAQRIAGGDIQRLLGVAGPPLLVAVQIGLCWLLLYWLYRKGLTMKF